jgi:hypothetical protein
MDIAMFFKQISIFLFLSFLDFSLGHHLFRHVLIDLQLFFNSSWIFGVGLGSKFDQPLCS